MPPRSAPAHRRPRGTQPARRRPRLARVTSTRTRSGRGGPRRSARRTSRGPRPGPAPVRPAAPAARAPRTFPTGRRRPPGDHRAQSVPNGARLRCQIVADTEAPIAGLREEEIESRWEAAPAVGIVIAMQLVLALVSRNQVWQLWVFPWWV